MDVFPRIGAFEIEAKLQLEELNFKFEFWTRIPIMHRLPLHSGLEMDLNFLKSNARIL